MVERLFLAVPRGCLQFVIVVFPDHTHLLFLLLPIQLGANWCQSIRQPANVHTSLSISMINQILAYLFAQNIGGARKFCMGVSHQIS